MTTIKKSLDYDSKYQTFCIYCQREYETFAKLKTHLRRIHPNTYAQVNLAPKAGPV